MADNILEVKRLKVSFRTNNGTVKAVRDISFNVERGKTLAIVGESGSGKSVTSKVILGISSPNALIEGGEVLFDGKDLVKIGEDEMYDIRGDKIAMIFQDPLSSLDPIVKIGKQITEAMILKNRAKRKGSKKAFNQRLRILCNNMIEANDESKYSNSYIRKLIKEFDQFNLFGLRMYNEYCDSVTKATDLIDDLRDFLFLVSKHRRQNIKQKIKYFSKKLKSANNKFFLNKVEDKVAEYISSLNKMADSYTKKDYKINDDDYKYLDDLSNFLVTLIEREKPNFFRIGYYCLHNKESDLLSLSIKEMNDLCLKNLNENFMNTFLELTEMGIKNSFNKALEAKKNILAYFDECKEFYTSSMKDNKKASLALAKKARKFINPSIDPLTIRKDTVAYTFSGALYDYVRRYYLADKHNIKDEKRYNTQKAKYDAQIAKGKKIDWKLVPKKTVDLDDIISDIVNLIDRIENNYKEFIDNAPKFDFIKERVAVIDDFKTMASDVVTAVTKKSAKYQAIKLMEEVGIPEPRLRFNQYPFEFSGGMRQRIVIAIALAANPDLLICDEPTTALDVTIQSQILELINKIKEERGLSVIFITHDLGVVANMADTIAVMYAGKIVEYGTSEEIFYKPAHPYTWALLCSMPDLDTKDVLEAIPGTPPNMIYPPKGDAFAERNKYALKIDFEEQPPMFKISDTHYAATWLLDPRAPKVEVPSIITDRIKRMKKKGEEIYGKDYGKENKASSVKNESKSKSRSKSKARNN